MALSGSSNATLFIIHAGGFRVSGCVAAVMDVRRVAHGGAYRAARRLSVNIDRRGAILLQ